MYTPLQKAPPKFMKRYHAIKSGQEKLDTPQQLKDFWLFAIEQGWKSYEMREYIALLTEELDWTSPLVHSSFFPSAPHYSPSINALHGRFRDFKAMDKSPYPEDMTDEEYLDQQWAEVERDVQDFKPDAYDNTQKTG